MKDAAKIRMLEGALKEAQCALERFTQGTFWIGQSDVNAARRAIERARRARTKVRNGNEESTDV